MTHSITRLNTNTTKYHQKTNNKIKNIDKQDKSLYWFSSQENLHLVFALRTLRTIIIEKSHLQTLCTSKSLKDYPLSLESYKRKQ